MVNNTDFGIRLQKILDYYNISAAELSNQIKFNRSTISHLLSGRNKPSLDFVMRILQKYPEVELYWLLNGKGSFPSITKKSVSATRIEPILTSNKHLTNLTSHSISNADVDQIVIFFKDGTFKSYKN
ncbi:MAG: XRE family transcriptional regulator [Flavobacteriales bacterium]|nr:MAG: XRE family transcriptional regulator [Flavobacteriales bacterium]